MEYDRTEKLKAMYPNRITLETKCPNCGWVGLLANTLVYAYNRNSMLQHMLFCNSYERIPYLHSDGVECPNCYNILNLETFHQVKG